MFKSLTEKHHTVNHMIIFNDSISKFYQCSIQGFCRGISMFFSICLRKKNAEAIKFSEILKNMSTRIKFIFLKKRKAMFRLLEKLFFVFRTIFKFDFITQDNYCIIYKCLYSPFILFFSYISFSETEYRNNDNSSLFIRLAKVQRQNE